jgi:O-acetyl-ADP-ribose deacetylase (regulator of RNase III)
VRRNVLGVDVDVITEAEAIRGILVVRDGYVPFLGAGISKEAGVPLASEICTYIRNHLASYKESTDDDWIRTQLNWDDPTRRYSSCLESYGSPEARVQYFRSLLKGVTPSFAHHALALLMCNDILHRNALTTNFDKLIEQAFTEQNIRECQAIRMSEEADYFWGSETDKCYLLKLHGDYDTHNILNTREETRAVPSFFVNLSRDLLRDRGLLALGSAGNEESINKFLESLLGPGGKRFLPHGVRWGVYVGPRKPEGLSEQASADILVEAVEGGSLNRRLVEILSDLNKKDRPCCLFPVWGSGGFLLRLIEHAGDSSLEYRARLLMDHDMRIASLMQAQGIPPSVVEKHLAHLQSAQERLKERLDVMTASPRKVVDFELQPSGPAVEIVYCDITSQDLLAGGSTGHGRRSAIVSADDTMISAGGGVALSILSKAGPKFLLNELGKLAPISKDSTVVTSGGSLPVQYIIHAAALEIDASGDYSVTASSVMSVVNDTLLKAQSLGVERVYFPLIGAGVAGLSPEECLTSILQAAHSAQTLAPEFRVVIAILDDLILSRDVIKGIAQEWQIV